MEFEGVLDPRNGLWWADDEGDSAQHFKTCGIKQTPEWSKAWYAQVGPEHRSTHVARESVPSELIFNTGQYNAKQIHQLLNAVASIFGSSQDSGDEKTDSVSTVRWYDYPNIQHDTN